MLKYEGWRTIISQNYGKTSDRFCHKGRRVIRRCKPEPLHRAFELREDNFATFALLHEGELKARFDLEFPVAFPHRSGEVNLCWRGCELRHDEGTGYRVVLPSPCAGSDDTAPRQSFEYPEMLPGERNNIFLQTLTDMAGGLYEAFTLDAKEHATA